jgi:hypothetical protein
MSKIPLNMQKKVTKMHLKNKLDRITAVFRSHPQYAAPEAFVDIVKEMMNSRKFQLLNAL